MHYISFRCWKPKWRLNKRRKEAYENGRKSYLYNSTNEIKDSAFESKNIECENKYSDK